MFTLDRVSLTSIGLSIGLVLSGCASPTAETAEAEENVDQSTAALAPEEAVQANAEDDVQQPLQGQSDEAQPKDGDENTDSTSSEIFIGPGFGWGGGLGWGRGFGWGGGLGWGRGFGWGGGLGWGVPGFGWGGGWGFPGGCWGWGRTFVGGCGLYGCW